MARTRLAGASSRRLGLLLLAVAAPPAATLMWLGVQLLRQDRAIFAQRDLERRQAALASVARSLQVRLAEARDRIVSGNVPAGAVRFVVTGDGVRAEPNDRVLWLPRRATLDAGPSGFVEAERLEFQHQLDRAASIYHAASQSIDAPVRAGALIRLARVRRSQGRADDALAAYRDLARITGVSIDGTPADLQARRAAADVLFDTHKRTELASAAARLEADLLSGRWTLDRPAWDLAAADLERWTGRPLPQLPARASLSTAADTVWNAVTAHRSTPSIVPTAGGAVTLLSKDEDGATIVLALSTDVLRGWIAEALQQSPVAGAPIALAGADGAPIAGMRAAIDPASMKALATDTQLPWTIVVGADSTRTADAELARRRRLLLAGLASILTLLAAGSYALWRVVRRELAVSQLQTDFVSAVSHEFRTPLTSLRHVTELLQEDDDLSRERRRAFYDVLDRNADRLHRLVESLLDFARMEDGRKPYQLQPIAAADLVANVVADFQKDVEPRGYAIALDVGPDARHPINADAPSLANAVWNLLDNAVKYSPECRTVRVRVTPHPAGVAIAVQDQGVGVPAGERREIFGRFVRGAKAARLGIKGTGLGLAIVSHIVEAHGGTIDVESEEQLGSTFTIVLPRADRHTNQSRGQTWREYSSLKTNRTSF